jgi:hypothetical protein
MATGMTVVQQSNNKYGNFAVSYTYKNKSDYLQTCKRWFCLSLQSRHKHKQENTLQSQSPIAIFQNDVFLLQRDNLLLDFHQQESFHLISHHHRSQVCFIPRHQEQLSSKLFVSKSMEDEMNTIES